MASFNLISDSERSSDSDDEPICKKLMIAPSADDEISKVKLPDNINVVDRGSSPVKKKFSIWSDVLLDQQLCEDLANCSTLEPSRRIKKSDRSVESYNFPVNHKRPKKSFKPKNFNQNRFNKNIAVSKYKRNPNQVVNENESSFDKAIQNAKDAMNASQSTINNCKNNQLNQEGSNKRKRKKKKRNKNKKEQNSLSSDDYTSKMIITKLKEQKDELIRKVVNVLGCDKSLNLCNKTLDIESKGGMMTLDKKRKRTPGGVFFYLLKMSDDISEDQKKEIFGIEERVKRKPIRRCSNQVLKRPQENDEMQQIEKKEKVEPLPDFLRDLLVIRS